MSILPVVVLKAGREKKIRSFYPWVQREEVVRADKAQPGEIARLSTAEGAFLAIGTYNPLSRFPFRVFSLQNEAIDTAWFRMKLIEAQRRRASIEGTTGLREVFSEADGIPGLIVDRYEDVLVVQVRSAGMEALVSVWLPALQEVYKPVAIYERSEMEGRREEGLEPKAGILYGQLPERVTVIENGLEFEVPVVDGLKTGFYLDQRDARARLGSRVRQGDRVLDAFCYTGGFSVYAAQAGAECIGVDISASSIEIANRNAATNGLSDRCEFLDANAFEYVAEPTSGIGFDWIVLDPPAIAKQRDKKSSLKWGIWKLVFHAIDHLNPGGRMVVCSCSYQLGLPEMLDTIRLAASDRGKRAFLEEVTLQGADHPYLLQFPESLYLKCAWVRFESI